MTTADLNDLNMFLANNENHEEEGITDFFSKLDKR